MNILGRGRYFVISSYLQQLQAYLKQIDLSVFELLENSDLPLLALSQPDLYLGHESIAEINAHLCTLVPSETHLIHYLALERDPLTHGSLGVAVLLSFDLDTAISMMQKYICTRYSGMEIKVSITDDTVKVIFYVPKTNSKSDRLTVLSTLLMLEKNLRTILSCT